VIKIEGYMQDTPITHSSSTSTLWGLTFTER